jgi:hypothetical protein
LQTRDPENNVADRCWQVPLLWWSTATILQLPGTSQLSRPDMPLSPHLIRPLSLGLRHRSCVSVPDNMSLASAKPKHPGAVVVAWQCCFCSRSGTRPPDYCRDTAPGLLHPGAARMPTACYDLSVLHAFSLGGRTLISAVVFVCFQQSNFLHGFTQSRATAAGPLESRHLLPPVASLPVSG